MLTLTQLAIPVLGLSALSFASPPVELLHLPDHALQPRVAIQDNTIHLVYLSGDARSSDVQYRRWAPADKAFADPVRVNSQPGSAIAIGTVRGCELAVEPRGRVHVVWNGSDRATPRKQGTMTEESAPVCYSHSDDGKAFTPQQNVMQSSWALDGGASIAVCAPQEPGKEPRVAIVWHGADASKPAGEANRGIFIAWSNDRGSTFAPEVRHPDAIDGACACCGLHAFADTAGHLGILYRRAFKGEQRDESLLIEVGNNKWNRTRLDPWPATTCPMTTSDAWVLKDGILLAWETQGQVWLGKWDGQLIKTTTAAPGKAAARKHPRVTSLPSGEVLLAWTEGTAWEKGGSVAWQQFDAALNAIEGGAGHGPDLSAWGTAAVFPQDNRFVVVY